MGSLTIAHAARGVRRQLGPGAFVSFTPQDSAAWEAFVCAAELYRRADSAGRAAALVALGSTRAAAQQTLAVQRAFLFALITTLDNEPAADVVGRLWPQLDGKSAAELQLEPAAG